MTIGPYAAFQFPEFRYYAVLNFLLTAALMMQEVALSYELYQLTHNPMTLGYIGLAEALPFISLVLFGGHFADRKDKKTIMQIGLAVITLGSLILIWVSHPETRSQLPQTYMLLAVYGVLALIGFAKGFYSPAASSLSPLLVPREVIPNASTWYSVFWQTGAITGPAFGGLAYAIFGFTNTLWLIVAMLVIVMVLISLIEKKPVFDDGKPKVNIFESLREGIRYVFSTKIILYCISLDLFSVLFGGVVAILPVFAVDILHVGALELGFLRAAPSAGAILTMYGAVHFTPLNRPWRNMLIAVAGFGLATLVFAVSTNYWLSMVALFFTGAFDSISVVVRNTIMKMLPPDEMRGRVTAVNSVFVSTSNEIGAFESGLAATLMGTVPSVIAGGLVTMVIVTVVWIRSKELFSMKLN